MQAIKKSIIDYILLDPSEQDRLSVYIRYRNVPLYGQVKPNIVSFYNKNSLFALSKPALEANLIKNSPYLVQIQRVWL